MWIDIVACIGWLLLAASALICAITKTPLISYKVTYYNHPKGGAETEDETK